MIIKSILYNPMERSFEGEEVKEKKTNQTKATWVSDKQYPFYPSNENDGYGYDLCDTNVRQQDHLPSDNINLDDILDYISEPSDPYQHLPENQHHQHQQQQQQIQQQLFLKQAPSSISPLTIHQQWFSDYQTLLTSNSNLNPHHLQQMLKSKYQITPQTFYDNNIFIITDYKQYQKKLESHNKLVPTKYYFDEERIDYKLCVSKFEIPVAVKIVNSCCKLDMVEEGEEIGRLKGGFGEVYRYKIGGKYYCLKKIQFSYKKQEKQGKQKSTILKAKSLISDDFDDLIKQVGMNKLLGLFHISPKQHQISPGIDLLVYHDYACFVTQLCTPFAYQLNQITKQIRIRPPQNQNSYKQQELNKIRKSIEQKLLILYSLKIIHRDIKLDNIVYNEKTEDYLLIDFGISQAAEGSVFEQSTIHGNGESGDYTHWEIRNRWANQKRKFCLQYTDYYSYRKTMINVEKVLESLKIRNFDAFEIQQVTIGTEQQNPKDKQNKLMNFCSFIKPLYLLFKNIWQNKTKNIIKQCSEYKEQLELQQLFFSPKNMIKVRKSLFDLQTFQFQQGLKSIFTQNQICNFYFALDNQYNRPPIETNQIDKRQEIQKLERKVKEAVKLKIMHVKLNQKMSLVFLNKYETVIPGLIDTLLGYYDNDYVYDFKIEYFTFLKRFLVSTVSTEALFKQWKLIVKNQEVDVGVRIKYCQDVIFLRQFDEWMLRYCSELWGIMKNSENQATITFLIDILFLLLSKHSKKYSQQIEFYLHQAQLLSDKLKINLNYSRLALKLQLIKVLFLSQTPHNQDEAICLTLQIQNNIKKYFGQASCYHKSLLLNKIYLMRQNTNQSNELIKEFLLACNSLVAFSVVGLNHQKGLKHESLQLMIYQDKAKSFDFKKQLQVFSDQFVEQQKTQSILRIINWKFQEFRRIEEPVVDQIKRSDLMQIIAKCYSPEGKVLSHLPQEKINNLTIFNLFLESERLYINMQLKQMIEVLNARLHIQYFLSKAIKLIQLGEEIIITKDSNFCQLFTEIERVSIRTLTNKSVLTIDNMKTIFQAVLEAYINKILSNRLESVNQFKFGSNMLEFNFDTAMIQNFPEIFCKIMCQNQKQCPEYMVNMCQFVHYQQLESLVSNNGQKLTMEFAGLLEENYVASDYSPLESIKQFFEKGPQTDQWRQKWDSTRRKISHEKKVIYCKNGTNCEFKQINRCRYYHPQSDQK